MRQPINYRMSRTEERAIEDGWKNDAEAFELLGLIDAEFRTDPMSVQCFDSRIVERVRFCVARHEELKKRLPFP